MPRLLRHRYALIFFVTASLCMLGIYTPANAGIVTTTDIVHAQQHEIDKGHLQELLSREDIKEALVKQGVDVHAAQQRVAGLTESEIQLLTANMDQLPAGGRLSTIEWLLIIIIIILLV